MKHIIQLVLTLLCFVQLAQAQVLTIGERHTIQSEILQEERSYQIYYPPSYFSNPNASFPVLYALDGDFNFHYDSGLVEFLSNGAFTIPEMIVIGISDKGWTNQKINTDAKQKADDFMAFIGKELKPHIDKLYRTSSYDVLTGHSKFGIFATHYWMTGSSDFDAYIAIDPSYWANDMEIVDRLEDRVKNGFKPTSVLTIGQANTPGMGIDEYTAMLEKTLPNSPYWKLNKYPEEGHGSVHLVALSDGLRTLFDGWEMTYDALQSFKSGDDIVDYYKKISGRIGTEVNLSWYALLQITGYFTRKNKTKILNQFEEGIKAHFPSSLEEYNATLGAAYVGVEKYDLAKNHLDKAIALNANSYKAYQGLAKLYQAQSDKKAAKEAINKALTLGKEMKVRQFYMNEMQALADQLK